MAKYPVPKFNYVELPCECGMVFKVPYLEDCLRSMKEWEIARLCPRCGRFQYFKGSDMEVVH